MSGIIHLQTGFTNVLYDVSWGSKHRSDVQAAIRAWISSSEAGKAPGLWAWTARNALD
jgi:hypothetical protein